jgi:hypothetical protein
VKTASIIVGLAIAAIATATPAEARVTSKDKPVIRNIVRQELELAKDQLAPGLPGPPGEPGAPGPAGPPGRAGATGVGESTMRFAYILPDGTVDTRFSSGITQDNVFFIQPDPASDSGQDFYYCITGIPNLRGGQVTAATNGREGKFPTLKLNPEIAGCEAQIIFYGQFTDAEEPEDFFVLLY